MEKRKPRAARPDSDEKAVDFCNPYDYFEAKFGSDKSLVKSWVISPTVKDLGADFLAFEDLNNSDRWPVSKIIQREIDHERVEQISASYLLAGDDTLRFFPPLTCVLLPLMNNNLPADKYDPPNANDLSKFDEYASHFKWLADYQNSQAISGGIFFKALDTVSGAICWDKTKVAAVIIDGQHRRSALLHAKEKNRDFLNWKVPVQIVDINDISHRLDNTVTDTVRDLFLHVNKTPVHVDGARIILMDDRDLVAKCVQVVLDDDSTETPTVRPELVDWHSKGGKYEAEYLTGVVPLYFIIETAFLSNSALVSLKDRQKPNKVTRFVSLTQDLLGLDDAAYRSLGVEPHMQLSKLLELWKLANKRDDNNPEENESCETLFNLPPSLLDSLVKRFAELYLPVFKSVFSEFEPYKSLQLAADSSGATSVTGDKNLRKFLRGTLAAKEEVRDEAQIKEYIKKFSQLKASNIFHTVMGQKAVFRCVIELLQKAQSKKDASAIKRLCKDTIEALNVIYLFCENERKGFFKLDHKITPGKNVGQAGDLASILWKGIVVKVNNEIDYGNTSVEVLSNILKSLVLHVSSKSEKPVAYELPQRSKILKRHSSILKTHLTEKDDKAIDEIADTIVEHKEKILGKLVKGIRDADAEA